MRPRASRYQTRRWVENIIQDNREQLAAYAVLIQRLERDYAAKCREMAFWTDALRRADRRCPTTGPRRSG